MVCLKNLSQFNCLFELPLLNSITVFKRLQIMRKPHKASNSDLLDFRHCFRTIERNHWLCTSRWLLNIKCIVFNVYTKLTTPRIEWIPNLVNAIFHAVCLVWKKFTWNLAKTFQWKCVKGHIIGFLPIYNE